MKQVVIVANFAPAFGGNFIQSLKALQSAKGISIRYVLPQAARSCEWISELTKVYYTDWSIHSLSSVWKDLNQEAMVDIVHFHFIGGMSAVRCKLAFRHAKRRIWHLHNHVGVSQGKFSTIKNIIKKWIYCGSYKIGVSYSVSNSMKAYSPTHIFTVYNAMDFERLSWIGEDTYIDAASGILRCMIMGNHYERKGVDMAAKAVQMLNRGGASYGTLYCS